MRNEAGSSDARVVKTRGALTNALRGLVETRRFGKITIFDICGAACVSRATFYAHFVDKYDLLKYCLTDIRAGFEDIRGASRPATDTICDFLRDNTKFVQNLLRDPDQEVVWLLSDFIADTLSPERDTGDAWIQFCAGGLISILLSHMRGRVSQREAMLRDLCHVLGIIGAMPSRVFQPTHGAGAV
jgi:AcrR family transcriptional regulator